MRVLVTRPEPSAARTAARLEALGHAPLLLPLSAASHDLQAAIAALKEPYGALAVTSAEAVRVLSAPTVQPFVDRDTPLYAVGAATAAAAQPLHLNRIHIGSGTGLELAELIVASSGDHHLPILYLAGKPRSTAFEERLQQAGIPLRVQEIYEMHPIEHDPAEAADMIAQVDTVLLYSQEAASRFFSLAPHAETLAGKRILCISERTAFAVPQALRNDLVIAKTPDEDALLALL